MLDAGLAGEKHPRMAHWDRAASANSCQCRFCSFHQA